MKGKEGRARVLTERELARASAVALQQSRHGQRNAALLAISQYCGLRAKEMAGLRLSDVLTADRELKTEITLRTATTKGGKKRMAYLAHPKLRKALEAYLVSGRKSGKLKNAGRIPPPRGGFRVKFPPRCAKISPFWPSIAPPAHCYRRNSPATRGSSRARKRLRRLF
jgi:integrase